MLNRLVLAALLCASAAFAADAPTTLQARDIDGNGSIDAYYDAGRSITWLTDANYLGTTGQGTGNPYSGPGSTNNRGWGGFLVYGTSGWRAPNTIMGQECLDWFAAGRIRCSETIDAEHSELAYLATVDPSLYFNVKITNDGWDLPYWLNMTTEHAFCSQWCSNVSGSLGGDQFEYDEAFAAYVWFIHDGDIGSPVAAPIPEPAGWMLMLLGLAAIARHRNLTA